MAPQNTHNTRALAFEDEAASAAWDARWEWQRLADRAAADRTALVTDQVWQQGYALAYRDAYGTVAQRVAEQATRAAGEHPEARPTLTRLAAAALAAANAAPSGQPPTPPADARTLAAATARADTNRQQPWKPVAHTAWEGSLSAGTIAGTLAAATDIVIDWRARGGHRAAGDATVHGRPATAWIADLLASVNHATVTTGPARPGTAPTAAQLARQDQAAGAAAPTSAPVAGRREDTAPAAAAAPARSR